MQQSKLLYELLIKACRLTNMNRELEVDRSLAEVFFKVSKTESCGFMLQMSPNGNFKVSKIEV
jgi:hypothetical protein